MSHVNRPRDDRALRAVAIQYFINGAILASYVPRLPEIRESLGVDLAVIGQAITAASLGGLLGSWLCSRLMLRFGTKRLLITGSLALILLMPAIALAQSVWALIAVMATLAFVDVIVDVSVNMQGSVLSARRSTPVINRLHGLWSIGMFCGGLIASAMAATAIPLLWHLLIISLFLSVFLWFIGRDLLNEDGPSQSEHQSAGARLSASRFSLFAILGACAFLPEMVLSDWSPFRLREDLGASEGASAFAYATFGAGMVIGRLGGDWVAARLDRTQLLNAAMVLALLGLLLLCFAGSSLWSYVGLCTAGLGVSVLFPTLYFAAATDKGRPGAALGAMTAGSRGAMLLAPLTIGTLADSPSLSVGFAIAIVALPCLLLLWGLSAQLYAEKERVED